MWHLNLTSALSTCSVGLFVKHSHLFLQMKGASRMPLLRALPLNHKGKVVSGNQMTGGGTGGATERWRE